MRNVTYESSISTACPTTHEQELDRLQKFTVLLTLCPKIM